MGMLYPRQTDWKTGNVEAADETAMTSNPSRAEAGERGSRGEKAASCQEHKLRAVFHGASGASSLPLWLDPPS